MSETRKEKLIQMKNYPRTKKENVLYNDRFPLSNKYDATWIFKNQMGPHPLWLTEFLVKPFDLKPGMRVLDLGSGKGMTSVFLAREFGVQVYSADFDQWGDWTSPEIRWNNAKEYGIEDLVVPVKADAQNLPFAKEFFDAIVCVDAYIYFGQDEAYLKNLTQFLRPGGKVGMIVPGYTKDTTDGIPDYISEFLGDELWTWQSLSWWKSLWEKDEIVSVDVADTLPEGCDLWLRWDTALLASGLSSWPDETDIFIEDNGEYIGFIRMVATKKE
ncbi:MAG: methyltransferase domain-containing protein [Oscillospiraceae bacterium]|nr:methyltransferase domain-containing protein [Oscillospiraceae bacterium]